MQNKRKKTYLFILAFVVLGAIVLSLPPVWSRVSYHSSVLYRNVRYWLKPPSEMVFVPSTLDETPAAAQNTPAETSIANTPTVPPATPTEAATEAAATPTEVTPAATLAPTATTVPLPPNVLLTGISCERQFMNNCGPATLSMYLSFYDWGKNQLATQAGLRPNAEDVNVMPAELVDFVNESTDFEALWRYGGDLQTLRMLLAAGYPVMIERGFEPFSLRSDGWVGHYNLVVGYDDDRQSLTVQDSYLMSYPPWGGGEIPQDQWDTFIGFDFAYAELEQTWRHFNYVFLVVYPSGKEAEVLSLIGPHQAVDDAAQIAYDRATLELTTLTDVRDQFFAWYNAGTSLVELEDYEAAAAAYDTAFGLYPDIPQDSRPYRMLWYEPGPYAAYFYAGRYQDVINLADKTLGYMAKPVLEESYYWRAMAYNALGDTTRAIADLRTSLVYHPGYKPSQELLNQLTGTP